MGVGVIVAGTEIIWGGYIIVGITNEDVPDAGLFDNGSASVLVIAIDSDSKLSAFRRNEKNLLWKSEKFFLRKISAPVIWQSAVWFVDGQGYLHGLSLFNGKVISRYKLKDGLLSGMIKIVQDGILIQTAGGQLVLLKKT